MSGLEDVYIDRVDEKYVNCLRAKADRRFVLRAALSEAHTILSFTELSRLDQSHIKGKIQL